MTTEQPGIELRVARLETSARMWRSVALGSFALAAIGASAAFRRAKPEVVDADRVTLRTPAGRRAVELSATGGGGLQIQFLGDSTPMQRRGRQQELLLLDPNGREIARIGSATARPAGR